jgi:hypothetical protein
MVLIKICFAILLLKYLPITVLLVIISAVTDGRREHGHAFDDNRGSSRF